MRCWEMTEAEFRRAQLERFTHKGEPKYYYTGPDTTRRAAACTDVEVEAAMAWHEETKRLIGPLTGREILADPQGVEHRRLVENAIKAGKPVAVRVIADYM